MKNKDITALLSMMLVGSPDQPIAQSLAMIASCMDDLRAISMALNVPSPSAARSLIESHAWRTGYAWTYLISELYDALDADDPESILQRIRELREDSEA